MVVKKMKFEHVTEFVLKHPKSMIGLVLILTLFFGMQFPKIAVDTDPKHMLPAASPVRQYNDQVERDFALHPDVIVLGMFNPDGIFNPQSLKYLKDLTNAIREIPDVISRDVDSLTTVDNVISLKGELVVKPALNDIQQSDSEFVTLRQTLLDNPLFVNRFVSPDSKATAIYIPIEPAANGKEIADKIHSLLPQTPGNDQFHLAGDPVARDTFGTEMFRQMALFS